VSLGTATTLDVVDSKRKYLGGLIAAGMKVSVRALAQMTSKLPEVELHLPERIISQTTQSAILSGIVNGQIAMVAGLLERAVVELGETPTIVATGGFAEMIANEIKMIDVIDADLTLEGLREIAQTL
jgi:type III pantothenate kinase